MAERNRNMDDSEIARTTAWLIESGLRGMTESELLQQFCERSVLAGLNLSRATVAIDTLHPIYEGRAFRWRNDDVEECRLFAYGRTNEGEAAVNWQQTPYYHLLITGSDELRRRIGLGEPADFHLLHQMKAEGQTDYVAFVHRFSGEGAIGEIGLPLLKLGHAASGGVSRSASPGLCGGSCRPSRWRSSAPRSHGSPAPWSKYTLGRGAGRRVLSGRDPARGSRADQCSAVVSGSGKATRRSPDSVAPEQVIPPLRTNTPRLSSRPCMKAEGMFSS